MAEQYIDSGSAGRAGPLVDAIGSASRYDLISAAIPTLLLAAATAGLFTDVSLEVALGTASLLASLFVVDALFVNPPGA